MVKPVRDLVVHIILFSLLLTGCAEEDCLSDNSSSFVLSFEDSETDLPVPQLFTVIETSGIEGQREAGPAAASFTLPVNPHADETTFTFKTEDTIEQITISYTRKPHILSAECSYEIKYENLLIVNSTFTGEAVVLKSNLDNNAIPNVTIYR